MITEIIGTKVVVESHGKKAGVYLIYDFDIEELKEEKAILISQLFTKGIEECGHIYDMVALINGELDMRKIAEIEDTDYFNLAAELMKKQAKNIEKSMGGE